MADYEISLGINLTDDNKLKEISRQLNSLTDNTHRIRVDIDNSRLLKQIEHAKKELKELNSTKGNRPSLTVNTQSLEKSLSRVADVIEEVRNSLGTLDNKSGMQSLLSSVNQIATALGKVENESDSLLKSLSALSKKDFSVNLGIKLGSSNSVSNNIAYSDFVKDEVLPTLQKQERELEKYLSKYFKTNELSAINKLAGNDFGGIGGIIGILDKLNSPLKKSESLKDRMREYKNFINTIISSANLQGIDLSPVLSQFDKLPDELIETADGIRNGTKQAEDSFEKLQQVFGGGKLNVADISAQLEPIIDKLGEIKTAIEDLSKVDSLSGLTVSFDRLSETLENLTSNLTLAKNVLGDGLSNVINVDTGSVNKIEKASDDSTAAIIQNEKKKQEAYKATTDTVLYHAGVISKLNKAETNGRFYGSNRGTGYFGTGHYFVDSATKHELDNSYNYSKLPYTSIDISKYDNLFDATSNEVAGKLHDFLRNLTRFTQGSDSFDVSELFSQFKSVFGDTIMDIKEFGSRLDQLKSFMSKSNFSDRSDSVSTQFMKSLGYEGVDTRGTDYADTRYGTVIYDLKEESILQANITDELQKQGQMLEKINYEKGQVFDKDADARIQEELDAQIKRREIAEEFEKSFDSTNLDKADADLTNIKNRIEEIDGAISQLQHSLNNLDQAYEDDMRTMKSLGFDDDDLLLLYDKDEWKKEHTEIYQDSINQLSKEKAGLQSKIPVLEETYNRESQLAQEAYKQAQQVVEQRHLEAQQAQETANVVVQNEERKQQAYQETAREFLAVQKGSFQRVFSPTDKEFGGINNTAKSVEEYFKSINGVLADTVSVQERFDADKNLSGFTVSLKNANGAAEQLRYTLRTTEDTGDALFEYTGGSVNDNGVLKQMSAISAKADTLQNKLDKLKSSYSDQNVSRPIKDDSHIAALSEQYDKVEKAIIDVRNADESTFASMVSNAQREITTLETMVSEFKNAENVASKMKSTDFASALDIAKNDLEKFKAQAKDFPQITQTIENLDKAIEGVGDASSLNKFNDQLRVARSELAKIKSEASAANRSEKVGINVSGLESKITDLQRISPEIDKFEAEIDGAKVSVQSLLADLRQVNTQGDFSVVNSKWKAFTDAAKAAGIAVTETATKLKSASDIKLDIELGTYDNQMSQMYERFDKLSGASDELRNSITKVENAYREMELAAGTGDEVADTERLIQAQQDYARALEKTNNLIRMQARAEKADNDKIKLDDDIRVFQQKIDTWLTKNSAASQKFGAEMRNLQVQAKNCDRITLNHLEKEFRRLDSAADQAGLKVESLADRIKSKFKEYSAYLSVAEVFMYISQAMKDMFEQVKAIDSAMTELKKVTNETDASYNQFLSNAASRAKEIGTTIDGLVTSTADFARLGYGFQDAQELAEVANIYAVVGDEIDSVETATESLISTMTAFGVKASDSMSIVDKFNAVGNNFAISSGGIGEALERSASSMAAANNSLDETIALITAANTVVQDADSVGTAFKTISMRIRGATTDLEEAGLDTEGMASSTAKLREEIMALSGVDIMLDSTTFKSTYKIMEELATKWEHLTDIQQASITELIAGKIFCQNVQKCA